MRTIDPGLIRDATGLNARTVGISLYAPFADEEPERPAEGACAFDVDYYRRYDL